MPVCRGFYDTCSKEMSESSSSKKRPVLLIGVVGVSVVIILILGMAFLQMGSNVSEVSSTTSTYSTSSSNRTVQVGSSSATTSSTFSSSSSSTYYGPTGILGVSLTDPPIVPPGVTDVYISYSSVEVHVADAGNEDGWYQVADAGSVDLMSLINVSLTLGSAEVQTGTFNVISFNITSAGITLNGANVTAYVPANRISVPIIGGISVSTGNSSGVLVDLSPEVIPYQNGTSVSYVLVPEAKSLPIPHNVWNRTLEVKGAELQQIQNQTWVTNSTGQVVVSGVSVTPNSFSLTLQNEGNQNVSFSSIVLGQVISLPVCYATPNSQGNPKPLNVSVSNETTVSIVPSSSSYIGNQTIYISGQVYPAPSSPNTTALVTVNGPGGNVVESINSSVELSGAFHAIFNAGANTWVDGMYNVTAAYNGSQGYTSFQWSLPSVTVTSTVSSSSSTSENSTTVTQTLNSTTTFTNTTIPRPNITVTTNAASYFGNATILIYGAITPPPPPTATDPMVYIRVLAPEGVFVFKTEIPIAPNGTFSVAFPAGGVPGASTINGGGWTNGTYTVYAYSHDVTTYAKFDWSGPSAVLNFNDTSTATTQYTNTTAFQNTTRPFLSSLCGFYGSNDGQRLPPSLSVAYFAIMSNGTLYPVNYTSLILSTYPHHNYQNVPQGNSSTRDLLRSLLTYTLAPGQSVTFTYNGKVDSLTGILLSYLPRNFAVPSSLFQINPGSEYTVMASGPFDARVAAVVNATSTTG